MKVQRLNNIHYSLSFDNPEIVFLENEAKDNNMTTIEMFEMILGMLFVGGYSNIVGKDGKDDVEG